MKASMNARYGFDDSGLNLLTNLEADLNRPDVFTLNIPKLEVWAGAKPTRTLFLLGHIIHAAT
jgi:hypothetical protein